MPSEYRSMVLFALVFGRYRNKIFLIVDPTMIISVGDGLKTSACVQEQVLARIEFNILALSGWHWLLGHSQA